MNRPIAISLHLGTTLQSTIAIIFALLSPGGALSAEPIPVRHQEGTVHGFLVIRTLEGRTIATGDLIQVPDEDRITSRLTFRFKDGSIDDETTIFSQRKFFRLISDHLVEKGPSFPDPVDMSIEMATGTVTVHATDGQGKDRVNTYHFDFPPDQTGTGETRDFSWRSRDILDRRLSEEGEPFCCPGRN